MADLLELANRVEAGKRAISHIPLFMCDESGSFTAALNGSLDAAKALHDAVLPGWGRVVDATAPEMGIMVEVHRPDLYDGASFVGDCKSEACAWVAAILRAKAGM